jgi:hypothetical protein
LSRNISPPAPLQGDNGHSHLGEKNMKRGTIKGRKFEEKREERGKKGK